MSSTWDSFKDPDADVSHRKKRQASQLPGVQEMIPFAQIPEVGTGTVNASSNLPSRSLSRAMLSVPISPVSLGWASSSINVALFWQARLGVKVFEESTVAIGCPARPGVT